VDAEEQAEEQSHYILFDHRGRGPDLGDNLHVLISQLLRLLLAEFVRLLEPEGHLVVEVDLLLAAVLVVLHDSGSQLACDSELDVLDFNLVF